MATFDARDVRDRGGPAAAAAEEEDPDEKPVGWRKKKPVKKLSVVDSLNLAAKALALVPGAKCRVHGLRGARRYNYRVGTILAAREVASAAKATELLRYEVALDPVGAGGHSEVKFDCEADDDGTFDLSDAAYDVHPMDAEEQKLVDAGRRKVLKVKLGNLSTLMRGIGPEVGPYGSATKVGDDVRAYVQECVNDKAALKRFLAQPELPALRASGDLRWKSFVDGVRAVGIIGLGPHLDNNAVVATVASVFRKMRSEPWAPPPKARTEDEARMTPKGAGLFSKEATKLARDKRDAKRAAFAARKALEEAAFEEELRIELEAERRALEEDRRRADEAAQAALDAGGAADVAASSGGGGGVVDAIDIDDADLADLE